MNILVRSALLATAVSAATMATNIYANPKEANVTAKPSGSPSSTGVTDLALADQLAAWGEQNKDAVALVTAAKIKMGVTLQDSKTSKINTDSEKPAAEKPAKPDNSSAEALLQRARALAGDRADLLAVINSATASNRGAAGGANVHRDQVRAGATDIYNIRFVGGEEANIGISGDGDTDLDLFVYDENDNLICSSETRSDDEACTFYPRWTGSFTVKVKNFGDVYNRYLLLTD